MWHKKFKVHYVIFSKSYLGFFLNFSTLFTQMTKPRPDNQIEINRKKALLNEEEERYLRKFNKSSALKKLSITSPNKKQNNIKESM